MSKTNMLQTQVIELLDSSDSEGDLTSVLARKKVKHDDDEPSPIVRLNVGGVRYEVARDTLMRYEGSMLASLISGKWKEGNGNNEIFIDRDGGRFKYIIDYLRSDRVYLSELSDLSALKDEFDYFGFDADMSKISMQNDYVSIRELGEEIKQYEAIIEEKKTKIAAIKESYRLVSDYTHRGDTQGLFLRLEICHKVDKELLRDCLLSRGLYVVSYSEDHCIPPTVDICILALKDKYANKGSS